MASQLLHETPAASLRILIGHTVMGFSTSWSGKAWTGEKRNRAVKAMGKLLLQSGTVGLIFGIVWMVSLARLAMCTPYVLPASAQYVSYAGRRVQNSARRIYGQVRGSATRSVQYDDDDDSENLEQTPVYFPTQPGFSSILVAFISTQLVFTYLGPSQSLLPQNLKHVSRC